MKITQTITNRLRRISWVREIIRRYGRSYWSLPKIFRRRLCWESKQRSLPDSQSWRVGLEEKVERIRNLGMPGSLGHELAAEGAVFPAGVVTRVNHGWLVGKYATPVTVRGDLLATSFRDEPRIMGLEQHLDLKAWLSSERFRSISSEPAFNEVWPMVNRLQTNYFHWLVEWCGRLELVEAYENETGTRVRLLTPVAGPRYIRDSLSLLGYGEDRCITWGDASPPSFISGIVLPSFRGSHVATSPAALKWLRQRFLAATQAPLSSAERVIYISRAPGGWRSVLNDDEVCAWCMQEGFDVVKPETMSLAEQIECFARAKLIVGLHGSGLTNILFARQAAMLELFGSYGDGVWYAMTSRLGQHYETMRCTAVCENVLVDINILKRRIARMLKTVKLSTAEKEG